MLCQQGFQPNTKQGSIFRVFVSACPNLATFLGKIELKASATAITLNSSVIEQRRSSCKFEQVLSIRVF
jgi:hypothetical protein